MWRSCCFWRTVIHVEAFLGFHASLRECNILQSLSSRLSKKQMFSNTPTLIRAASLRIRNISITGENPQILQLQYEFGSLEALLAGPSLFEEFRFGVWASGAQKRFALCAFKNQ